MALYGATEGTEIWTALPQAPTAREAIERFLHASACPSRGRASRRLPHRPGRAARQRRERHVCHELRERRAGNVATLRDRLERAIAEGELPEDLDCDAMATFYATVQQGMSIQARDGASRETLLSVADCAMAAWEGLTAAPQD